MSRSLNALRRNFQFSSSAHSTALPVSCATSTGSSPPGPGRAVIWAGV